eukprot:TRINITY_DN618_c1_g1_i1.p3 TRINITY_DN618_c1_g1~~TRINITY_DN618_c1_g1_i1.p3  ORF type:complete len:120 (-),score=5.72 TRINITY_DN618_c1_g1_i1:8-367(-)
MTYCCQLEISSIKRCNINYIGNTFQGGKVLPEYRYNIMLVSHQVIQAGGWVPFFVLKYCLMEVVYVVMDIKGFRCNGDQVYVCFAECLGRLDDCIFQNCKEIAVGGLKKTRMKIDYKGQ